MAPTASIYDILRPAEKDRSLRRLPVLFLRGFHLVWESAPRAVVVTAVLQLLGALALILQLLSGRRLLSAVLAAGGDATMADLAPTLGFFALASAVGAVAAAVAPERQRLLGELVRRNAMNRIIDVTNRVELEAFDDPVFLDGLLRAKVQSQVRPLQLTSGLLAVGQSSLTVAGVVVALGAIEPILLPLGVASVVPLAWASRRNSRGLHRTEAALTANDRERLYLEEVLSGREAAKEVRVFRLGPFLRRRYDRLWAERISAHQVLARSRAQRTTAAALMATAALVGAAALLLWLVLGGRTTAADATTAAIAAQVLAGRLRALHSGTASLYECSLFLNDVTAFLDIAPTVGAGSGGQDPRRLESLVVDGVSFGYPGTDGLALRDISLELRAGEVVALVGENGSGKTTLAKLLCGLYRPTEGSIRWNGRPLGDLDRDALRRQIGVIFQDFLQYQLPAGANIAMGRHEAFEDHAAIVAAAELAGAHDFVSALPAGYDTLLTRAFLGGVELSIGEWQRVAVARAFFSDSSLLVLDEPTAALDPRGEHELFESVRALAKGRTVVLISHRFSTVKSADRIYVIDDGRIAASGTHDELVAAQGLYAELFTLQASAYLGAKADGRGGDAAR